MKWTPSIQAGLLLALVCTSGGFAEYQLADGTRDFYFGHISYLDATAAAEGADCLVFREGQEGSQTAVLNLPLGPGDTIQGSARRCEIQFDNGTIVRLDLDSRLRIESILERSRTSDKKLSNLVLEGGQIYVMYKTYGPREIFQVLTPHAAVKLDHDSVASIRLTEDGSTDVQVEAGDAHLLSGSSRFRLSRSDLEARQRMLAAADDTVAPAEYQTRSDFKTWNESVNSRFAEVHSGNALPKPLQDLPKAVFNFAQQYGSIYGEWFWHDLYGYVWRPSINDRQYPWGNWAPYLHGEWVDYHKQAFWVPGETWGWVPYHLGIWMWDKNKGWLWLPGSLFAPAWATWDFYQEGYFAWRPLSLFDWIYPSQFWLPCDTCLAGDVPSGAGHHKARRPGSPSQDRAVAAMPREMKKAYERLEAAVRRKDPEVLGAMSALRRQTVLVRREDAGSPAWRDKIVPYDRFVKEVEATPRNDRVALPERTETASTDAQPVKAPAVPRASELRFRDWNPDVSLPLTSSGLGFASPSAPQGDGSFSSSMGGGQAGGATAGATAGGHPPTGAAAQDREKPAEPKVN